MDECRLRQKVGYGRDADPLLGGWGGVVFWGEHVTLADAGSFAVVRVVGVVLVGRKEQVTIPVELRRKWGEGMRVVVKAKGY